MDERAMVSAGGLLVPRRRTRATRARRPTPLRGEGPPQCGKAGEPGEGDHNGWASRRRVTPRSPRPLPADYGSTATVTSAVASSAGADSMGQWPVASSTKRQGGSIIATIGGMPAAIIVRTSSQAITARR